MDSNERRAELRKAYKEKGPPMGIFAVRNLRSSKLLLGRTTNLTGALNRARFQLELGGHPVAELQADWRALGPDAFSFEVLDTLAPPEEPGADPAEELEVLEALWLDRLKPWGPAGYHPAPG